jgi:AAA+ ATPase superfamily predicted ATPase
VEVPVVSSFVNREAELAFLERTWASRGPQLVVLYGRRRIGKTALIREFTSRVGARSGTHRRSATTRRDVPLVHYIAARLPEGQQLAELGQAVGGAIGDPILTENGFREWRQVLDLLATGRFALALDEFPYLVDSNRGLATLVQRAWDTSLAGSNGWLLLCGSSVAMMERETLDAASPLFGRRTGHLRLTPFGFDAARRFLQGYSFEDALRAFAILGGIPQYLQLVDSGRPLPSNIRALALDVGAPLADEVEFLLREELVEVRVYYGILAAIAAGKEKLGEIVNATHLAPGVLSKYLGVLQALGLIRREVPVTEHAPEKSKRGLYRICDPLVRFSFRHLLPLRALLQSGRADEALAVVAADLDMMASWAYEEVCREIVASGRLPFDGRGAPAGRGRRDEPVPAAASERQRTGRWWTRTDEIDVVAFGARRILAGEVKWSRRPVGADVLRSLEEKVARAGWTDRATLALFSRAGFTPAVRAAAAARRDLLLVHRLEVVA